jgi:hypothetical protein
MIDDGDDDDDDDGDGDQNSLLIANSTLGAPRNTDS